MHLVIFRVINTISVSALTPSSRPVTPMIHRSIKWSACHIPLCFPAPCVGFVGPANQGDNSVVYNGSVFTLSRPRVFSDVLLPFLFNVFLNRESSKGTNKSDSKYSQLPLQQRLAGIITFIFFDNISIHVNCFILLLLFGDVTIRA